MPYHFYYNLDLPWVIDTPGYLEDQIEDAHAAATRIRQKLVPDLWDLLQHLETLADAIPKQEGKILVDKAQSMKNVQMYLKDLEKELAEAIEQGRMVK